MEILDQEIREVTCLDKKLNPASISTVVLKTYFLDCHDICGNGKQTTVICCNSLIKAVIHGVEDEQTLKEEEPIGKQSSWIIIVVKVIKPSFEISEYLAHQLNTLPNEKQETLRWKFQLLV